MSKFIEDNKLSPAEAMNARLEAGAAHMHIEMNNGAIEVTNGDGAVLQQSKNVPAGTWDLIWAILEAAGDVEFRAGS